MKCEVVREGMACVNDAGFIARTPWATQLACKECAVSFKRYGVEQIGPYACDWPMGGGVCGEPATHFFIGEGHHRPICNEHTSHVPSAPRITDETFDPKLVPYKPPVQQPRVVVSGDKVGLWCHCGKAGKYRGGTETLPLCDEHAPKPTQEFCGGVDREPIDDPTASPADASIRAAAKELVLLTLQTLKEKIIRWAK